MSAKQMNPVTPAPSSPWPRLLAWGAVICSTLPEIIWQESGHSVSCWFTAMESLLILAAALLAIWIPSLRGVTRFLIAVALLNLAWSCISPALAGMKSVRAVTDHSSWGARLFLSRIFTLSGAILVSFTLIGSGITRRDLFICRGNLAAPAQPIPFLGLRRPIPWTWLGPAFMLVFAVVLAPYLYLTVHPNFNVSERIIRTFPWSLAVAVLNAANEEFQFRSVLLAHLRRILRPGEAILLTAAFFGLGHYYGQPSGPLGVLMAGFAGWIWARSMIETRGGVWAFLIHFVQDIVIFTFLAVAAGM
jgi:membrane protease YdiL (CAAX protease family)